MRKFNTVLLGFRLTASEIAMGRVMRAPDHPLDNGFDEFVAAGEVEVGAKDEAAAETPKPGKSGKTKADPTPAPAEAPTDAEGDEGDEGAADPEGNEGGDEGDEEGDEGDEGEADDKGKARESQINRLKRERAEAKKAARDAARLNADLVARLEALENRLQPGNTDDNSAPVDAPAPDPTDATKYPLGHLDDAYMEDKLEWLATKKAQENADAVLQRQQAQDNQRAQQAQQAELLQKVDDLSNRGSEIYDDFQETVVEAGLKGDWDLDQPTFEAAAEAENGVQILYNLASDKAEATRVAKLSPYQQLKYVADKDAEITAGKTPRKIPRAGEPPRTQTRGANSRVSINPATDNLDDFEKLWEQDARKGNR